MFSTLYNLAIFAVMAGADSAADVKQQMVFGKSTSNDGAVHHHCDFSCTPEKSISAALIYKQADNGNPNQATPQQNAEHKKLSSPKGATRLSIPDSIQKDGSIYNFKLTTTDGLDLYTETWTYSEALKTFAHTSSVKNKWYSTKWFKVAAISAGVVAILAFILMLVRMGRKPKAAL